MVRILTDAGVDADAEFDKMIEEYNQMGGADYIDWYNQMISEQT